jgi:histone deacetylase 1/2
MKPIRIKMAHQLIVNYGLYRKMDVYEPHWATFDELTNFHSGEYINYMENISKKVDTSNITRQCMKL